LIAVIVGASLALAHLRKYPGTRAGFRSDPGLRRRRRRDVQRSSVDERPSGCNQCTSCLSGHVSRWRQYLENCRLGRSRHRGALKTLVRSLLHTAMSLQSKGQSILDDVRGSSCSNRVLRKHVRASFCVVPFCGIAFLAVCQCCLTWLGCVLGVCCWPDAVCGQKIEFSIVFSPQCSLHNAMDSAAGFDERCDIYSVLLLAGSQQISSVRRQAQTFEDRGLCEDDQQRRQMLVRDGDEAASLRAHQQVAAAALFVLSSSNC
jgi:hypothetical protein